MGKGEAPNSGKEENMEMKVLKKVKKTKAPVSGRSCIMVVGTSGTGKTTLLNLYTGAQELTGSGAQGVTNSTVVVEDTKHSNAPLWMDNPGWSDPGGKSDSHVFKDLLLQMQTLGIYNLKAVIWCVFPQLRMDATLQAQAKFIDEFTVESDAGRIWSNVVVVAKGKAQKTVAEDCQGACTAAKKLWVHAEPVCRGWELATPEIVNETTERLRKETLRCYTEEEILEELETVIKQLPPPVQVVFANQRCQSCGQTGDPRLMEDKCHRNKKMGHNGKLGQKYSKTAVGVAVAGGLVGVSALTAVTVATGAAEALIALPVFVTPGSMLAGHRFFNTPSTSPPPCGPVRINDMRWSCCKGPEIGGEGCTPLCDLCDSEWGSGAPCVLIRNPDRGLQGQMENYEVFIKNHDLVENTPLANST